MDGTGHAPAPPPLHASRGARRGPHRRRHVDDRRRHSPTALPRPRRRKCAHDVGRARQGPDGRGVRLAQARATRGRGRDHPSGADCRARSAIDLQGLPADDPRHRGQGSQRSGAVGRDRWPGGGQRTHGWRVARTGDGGRVVRCPTRAGRAPGECGARARVVDRLQPRPEGPHPEDRPARDCDPRGDLCAQGRGGSALD